MGEKLKEKGRKQNKEQDTTESLRSCPSEIQVCSSHAEVDICDSRQISENPTGPRYSVIPSVLNDLNKAETVCFNSQPGSEVLSRSILVSFDLSLVVADCFSTATHVPGRLEP